MTYPDAQDYIQAVQHPQQAFRRAELRDAVFDVHPIFGIPMPASGNAAVVFKAMVGGEATALRFFIREDASSRERYTALSRHFALSGIDDCAAPPEWMDDVIAVRNATWPMVRMTWVEGRTLDAYIGHLASTGAVGALASLAGQWRSLVQRLQAADFAHGDLQHGNVLVDSGNAALRLVDFDGAWIETFDGGPPPQETGHPNYQRTGREWGRWMDTFPGLVIYTALLTLARRPGAWEELHTGENILFSAGDFDPPFRTPAWATVTAIADDEVRHAADQLQLACRPGWRADGTLEALLGERQMGPIVVQPRATQAPIYTGPFLPAPGTAWWDRPATPGEPGQDGSAVPPRQMPLPPPKSAPVARQAGAGAPGRREPSFTPAASGWYKPEQGQIGLPTHSGGQPILPRPPAPRPPGPRSRRSFGSALAIALMIALLAAMVGAVMASGSGGDVGAAAATFGVMAGALALPLLLRKRRERKQ